jgi:hypothetical protein
MAGNLIASAVAAGLPITGSSVSTPSAGNGKHTFQGVVDGTGAVTATIIVEGSVDNINWVTLGTITLSGTTSANDGFTSTAWPYVRARVPTVLTGTGATVNVYSSYF